MGFQSCAITGGAGFAGSNLACSLRLRFPDPKVTAIDSRKRPGSEVNPPRPRDASVGFVNGDIRRTDDLAAPPGFDVLMDGRNGRAATGRVSAMRGDGGDCPEPGII